jgi:hypothetical protein
VSRRARSCRIGRGRGAGRAGASAWAQWQLAGSTGERPTPTVSGIEARIRELELEVAAADAALAEVLAQKVEFVQRHRDRLVNDADAETNAKRDEIHRLLAANT